MRATMSCRYCFEWPFLFVCLSSLGFTEGFGVAPPSQSLLGHVPVHSYSRFMPASRQLAVSYGTLMEKLPSRPVIEVVESSSSGKVIASDVAASAGVSFSQARKDLATLASLTKGGISVTRDGELIYEFPKNVKSVLSSNSAKYTVIQTFRRAWPALFYLVRVSFGVVLLASLALIFSTIFFLSQSSSSDNNDRRRDNRGFEFDDSGGSGMHIGYDTFWGPGPFDFFYYRPYYGYYAAPGQPARDPEELGFLESVFSYVFGDGNPNAILEETRLRLAANMIRENNGSVTAELLAPFCDDAPTPDEQSTYVNESFVLPIVSQLNGEPRVTEEGDIVYIFSDLQMSASSSRKVRSKASDGLVLKRAGLSPNAGAQEIKQLLNLNYIHTQGAFKKRDLVRLLERTLPPMTEEEQHDLAFDDPTMLQEREYKFSLASPSNQVMAGGLGVANLLGALYLWNMPSSYALYYGVQIPSYFGVIQAAFPLLLGYAFLFNLIPLSRSLWIKLENEEIKRRNKTRRLWRDSLQSSRRGKLTRKLSAASQMGTRMKQLGASKDDIVFDTRQAIEDIEKRRQRSSLDEFDQLLENDASN